MSSKREMMEPLEPTQNAETAEETRPSVPYVVGIGMSAGGLEALERLFAHLPADTGLAFGIVQHLDPTHDSHLAELLTKHTRMVVTQVTEDTLVRPNQVYVIAPNRQLE